MSHISGGTRATTKYIQNKSLYRVIYISAHLCSNDLEGDYQAAQRERNAEIAVFFWRAKTHAHTCIGFFGMIS